MQENSPLISIIIPVYNVEEYIKACLNSAIEQTYENLEIILVDDGSTDNSGKICDEYAKKDNRIRVIHKQNGGLSDARNAALEVFSGEYIALVDSDDYIATEYIEKLYNALIKYDADISVCSEQRVEINDKGDIKNTKNAYRRYNGELLMTAEQALDNYLRQDLFDTTACEKLYKAECFKGIRYPFGFACEDLGTTHKTFLKSKKVAYIGEPMYYYVQREGSILHSYTSSKRYRDGVKMVEQMRADVLTEYPQLQKAVNSRCLSMYFHAYIGACKTNDKELADYSWGKIKQLRFKVLFDSKGRRKARLASILSLFGKKMILKAFDIVS